MTIAKTIQKAGILVLFLFVSVTVFAQKPLPQVEGELKELAREVLFNENLDAKIASNKKFTSRLYNTLKRKESFSYDFDSLRTVSMLKAEDNTFRIFTWHIVDRSSTERNGGEFHYYFGLVQRPYTHPDGKFEMIVTPLVSDQRIRGGVENEILSDANWLGAQYYLPKYQSSIEKIVFKGGRVKARSSKQRQKYLDKMNKDRVAPLTGSGRYTDSVYVIGQGMTRVGGEVRDREFYVLYGWNGHDENVNYKIVDILSFDPQDPYSVRFGAGIFYFDPYTPKMRAVFKYSQNAPFSLNRGYVKTTGLFGGKKEVIIYDHLGLPNSVRSNPQTMWEIGPDGSYDGLVFINNKGFRWVKDVEPVDPPSKVLLQESATNQANILRARLREIQRLAQLNGDTEAVAEVEKMLSNDNFDKQALRYIKKKEKALAEQLDEIRKKEDERLKDAGIDLKKSGKSRGN